MITAIAHLPKKYKERISDVSDERGTGDGFWIYLKRGWQRHANSATHSVHKDTLTEAVAALKASVPCDCNECRRTH